MVVQWLTWLSYGL